MSNGFDPDTGPRSTRSQWVTINNPQGLHLRPAYIFAEAASKFESKIELVRNDLRIDGKSVLSILTLGAAQGTEVLIEATGADATDAVEVLQELLASGFSRNQSSEGGEPAADQAGNAGSDSSDDLG
jgi:phosphotransferase system HPr (HPr) family protein